MRTSSKIDTCPHCKKEAAFERDHECWSMSGRKLEVPVVCAECGERSIETYFVRFLLRREA